MDDDDYYYPLSVYAKVKLLLDYARDGYECVGTNHIGIYNLKGNYSYTAIGNSLPEATMAYWRSFGQTGKYGAHYSGESVPFLLNRRHKVLVFPFQFNMVAITHDKNITGSLRENKNHDNNAIYKSLDFETQSFINRLFRKIYSNGFRGLITYSQ
jgi:hypothetical protein